MVNDENRMSLEEVLAHLGVSKPTIYKYIREGKLTPIKDGRRTFFSRDNVESFTDPPSPDEITLSREEYNLMVQKIGELEYLKTLFDPSTDIAVKRDRFEGQSYKLGQLEATVRLIEDRRSWWRKLVGK